MNAEQGYSGYMPMVKQINVSQIMEMINTEGDLIHAHSIVVDTRENKEFVFSISQKDLVRLYFLLHKVLSDA
jgi:hypothetical protein